MVIVQARGPRAPTVQLLRDGQLVAEVRAVEVEGSDPMETQRSSLAQVPARPGDLLVLPGLSIPVRPGDGLVSVVDHPQGWRQVDLLPESRLEPVDGGALGSQAVVGGGTALLAMLILVVLSPGRGRTRGDAPPWRSWLLALALPVALLGTWPMAVAAGWGAGGALVQRNFDGFGSAWLLWLLARGQEALPHRLDTVAYALVGGPLAALLSPVAAYHWTTILGMAASFAAAAWVGGRVLGGGLPGGLAAGLAWAWSPLAGTAVVEGHGGWLLAPGLPLLVGAVLVEARGRPWREAGAVVAAGALCALQSGYVAVMAAVVVAVLGIARQRGRLLRVALLALPAAALYAALVLPDAAAREGGSRGWAWYLAMMAVLPDSDVASLDTLAGDPPGTGLLLRHVRHWLGWSLIAGGVLVPLLRRDRTGLLLSLLGAVGVVLALGPRLVLSAAPGAADGPGPLPYAWLVHLLPPLALFRFPVRFLWLWYLGAGLATARSVGWLWRASRPVAVLLLVAVGVEGLWAVRPLEPRTTLAGVPSAYGALQADDVVLDLWPLHAPGHGLSLELKELSCWYRTGHAAALPVPCLDVEVDQAALYPLQRRLAQEVVGGRPPAAELDAAGVTAVAWHPDAFSPELRPAIEATLRSWWGAPVATSADHGETVLLWRRGEAR